MTTRGHNINIKYHVTMPCVCVCVITCATYVGSTGMNFRNASVSESVALGIVSHVLGARAASQREKASASGARASTTRSDCIATHSAPASVRSDTRPSRPERAVENDTGRVYKKRLHPIEPSAKASKRAMRRQKGPARGSLPLEAELDRTPAAMLGGDKPSESHTDNASQSVWRILTNGSTWKTLIPGVDFSVPLAPCKECHRACVSVDEAMLVTRHLASVDASVVQTGLPFFFAMRCCYDADRSGSYVCVNCRLLRGVSASGDVRRGLPPFQPEWVIASLEQVALLRRLIGASLFRPVL